MWADNDLENVLTDREKASILVEAAVGPTVRGSDETAERRRQQQDRVAAALTAFADQHLKAFILQRFDGPAEDHTASDALVLRGGGQRRLVMYFGAFDTARQRARPLARGGDKQQHLQGRLQTGHVGLSFLMQQAEFVECRVGGGGGTDWVCREAFAPKGLCTTSKTADFMIEGVIRRCPLPLDDSEALRRLCFASHAQYFGWALDRASECIAFGRWLQDVSARLPLSAASHVEHCVAHGAALVKNRSSEGKRTCAHLHSFALLTRDFKTVQGLEKHIRRQVQMHDVSIRRQARPPHHAAWSGKLIVALFGTDNEHFLYAKQGMKKKAFLIDLEAVLSLVDVDTLGVVDAAPYVHWCYVTAEMAEASGCPVGAPCCSSPAASRAKVEAILVAWATGRPWTEAAISRWAAVSYLLNRFIVANIQRPLLVNALRDLRLAWSLADITSLERQLVEVLKQDPNDWASRTKLRLLRVAGALCVNDVVLMLSVLHIGHRCVDEVLYAAIGHTKTLREFILPSVSPVCKAQTSLTNLLANFSIGNPSVELLVAVGANLRSEVLRIRSRAHFMKLSAGLVDHFSMRWARPPYSVLLLDPRALVSEARKKEVEDDVLETPIECQPLMVRRWRARFAHRALLRSRCVEEANAFFQATPHSIDYVERQHTQFRNNLSSQGKGKHRARALTRHFCQQLKAKHIARNGNILRARDIAQRKRAGACVGKRGSRVKKVNLKKPSMRKKVDRRGSMLIAFSNMRVSTRKRLLNRRLRKEEVALLRHEAAQEWQRIGVAAQGSYKALMDVKRLGKTALQLPLRLPPGPTDFAGLFGSSSSADELVDMEAFSQFLKSEAGVAAVRGFTEEDDKDYTLTEAPPRFQEIKTTRTELYGCYAEKRSICKHIMPPHLGPFFDSIVGAMTRWANGMAKEEKELATAPLLWLRRGDTDGDDACDRVYAFAGCRESPKMQWLAVCGIGGAPTFRLPPLPCRLSMLLGLDRLSGPDLHLLLRSSDEVAWDLVRSSIAWEIRRLRWTLAVDGDRLLDLDVLEDLGPVPMHVKKSTDNGVLLSSRTVRAAQGGRLSLAGSCLPFVPVGPASFDAELDVDAEGEEFEAVAADVRADVLEFREATPSHEEDTAEHEEEDAAATAEGSPTPLQLVAAAFEDDAGYVYCGLEPFRSDSKYRIGRITSFPASRPPEERLWRAVCYQHTRCQTPPRHASCVTREQLLLWLFSPCPEGPAASDPPSHASRFV